MESQNTIGSTNYTSNHQPIFTTKQAHLSYQFFAPKNGLKDASFSSCMHPEYVGCTIDDSEINVFDAKKYFSESDEPPRDLPVPSQSPSVHKDNEADQPCDSHPVSRLSSVSSVDGYGRNFRASSFSAAPTASSEASWNSQTGLLSAHPGANPVLVRSNHTNDHVKKKRSSAARWILCKQCLCSGKKSVQVNTSSPGFHETKGQVESNCYSKNHSHISNQRAVSSVTEPRMVERTGIQSLTISNPLVFSSQTNSDSKSTIQRTDLASGKAFPDGMGAFSFPILSTASQAKLTLKSLNLKSSNPVDDSPRESLEVYQPIQRKSTDTPRGSITANFAFKNGTNHRGIGFPGSPVSRVSAIDEDQASDGSSDLFEIESFSTQTTSYPMYNHQRDSLDDAPSFNARKFVAENGLRNPYRRSLDESSVAPSIAATECYEPSEVSIDWSVTTAEGFASVANFSVTASESGEVAAFRRKAAETVGEEGMKWKGSGLLSCRHEKAVSVGPRPVKCVPEPLISAEKSVCRRPPMPLRQR